jgi:4-amino-4-deoxy-L-arabinose transferase-like glycosyltransferase
VVVCLAGLLLRLFRLGGQSFWNDEILTIDNAGGSLLDTLVGLSDPNILPLYYLTIRGLIGATPPEVWLRLPSALFGALSIPVFYAVLRHRGGRTLGLIGAAILAFSPFHVWYSQEARPYALLLLLSLVAVRALQLALERPTPARKTAAVLAAVSVFYCHTIGMGFILFLAVYVLLVTPKRRWGEWALAGVGTALLLTPGVARLLLFPPVGSADVFKPVSLWSAGYAAWAFATGYSLGPTPTEVHQYAPAQVVGPHLALITAVALCLAVLLVAGAVDLRRRDAEVFRSAVAWLGIPSIFALAGAMSTVHPFNVRYAILAFPAFVIFLAAGLRSAGTGRRRIAAYMLIAAIGLWSLRNYFFDPRYWRDDNRSAGGYLTAQARPGELVVATAGYTAQNLRYYYGGPAVTLVAYPGEGGKPTVVEGPGFAPVVIGARYVVPEAVPTDLAKLAAGHDRIWLFASRAYHSDPEGLVAQWLDRRLCRRTLQKWPGVELRLYVQPGVGRDCPDAGTRATEGEFAWSGYFGLAVETTIARWRVPETARPRAPGGGRPALGRRLRRAPPHG